LRSEQPQDHDVELLKAVAAKDDAALGQLYDRYRLILFGVLIRILNNREEAQDVLQEVFLQVWRRAADFDETRGRPFTWLVTLARSRGIDRLRSLSSREREVLQLVAEGRSTKEIADLLSISTATVETHRAHVLQKLDLKNTAGVVLFAARRGIVS
jgi:RNA polymerase sigma-70 factor (ECF subfamily)